MVKGEFTGEEAKLEQLMADLGTERYRSKAGKAQAKERETTLPPGRALLRRAVWRMGDAVRDWLRHSEQAPGPLNWTSGKLVLLDPEVTALITAKCVLDSISHVRKYTGTAIILGGRVEDEIRLQRAKMADPGAVWKVMKSTRYSSETYKRSAFRKVMKEAGVNDDRWDKSIKLRVGTVLLELLADSTGLVEFPIVRTGPKRTQKMVQATAGTIEWLERSHEKHEVLAPFYMPTVSEPADWEDPETGGYHTDLLLRKPLVATWDEQHLEQIRRARMPGVYQAVNAIQQTAWEVNPFVHGVLAQIWKQGEPVADLPPRFDLPMPPKPADIATNEEARINWRKAANAIHMENVSVRSKRIQLAKTLYTADVYAGKTFWYPCQLDFRGRLYCLPYFLQPQGTSTARGLLRFARGKQLAERADGQWLAIHGSNAWGNDKLPFEERVQWVQDNWAMIRAIGKDPLDNREWEQADKPWEFLAFCDEWLRYARGGGGFYSQIPVHMDGTNNGLQIFSLLLRDEVGGRATNCMPSDRPQDVYQDVADVVTAKLREEDTPEARKWLHFCDEKLSRKATKRPVMTLPYGSKLYSCRKYVLEWYAEQVHAGKPDVWGTEISPAVEHLSKLIWTAIGEVVGSARECMEWLHSIARLFNEQGLPMSWTVPTGFPVKQVYPVMETVTVRTAVGDEVKKASYLRPGSKLNKRRQVQGISPNYVHSLDAAALIGTLCTASQVNGIRNFSMVHDSYGVLAADAAPMASTLRRVYVELFSQDLLKDFQDQCARQLGPRASIPEAPRRGDLDVRDLLGSRYFFA